jgi:hypothetical protein
MMMLGGMLLAAVRSTRQLRRERDLRQCEHLLQAGIDRAAQRLTSDSAYRGETWSLPAPQIVGTADGRVAIEVADKEGRTQQVTVVAEYPLGDETSIRRSRTIVIPPRTQPSQE